MKPKGTLSRRFCALYCSESRPRRRSNRSCPQVVHREAARRQLEHRACKGVSPPSPTQRARVEDRERPVLDRHWAVVIPHHARNAAGPQQLHHVSRADNAVDVERDELNAALELNRSVQASSLRLFCRRTTRASIRCFFDLLARGRPNDATDVPKTARPLGIVTRTVVQPLAARLADRRLDMRLTAALKLLLEVSDAVTEAVTDEPRSRVLLLKNIAREVSHKKRHAPLLMEVHRRTICSGAKTKISVRQSPHRFGGELIFERHAANTPPPLITLRAPLVLHSSTPMTRLETKHFRLETQHSR